MVLEPVVDSITLFDDHYDIKLPSGETIRTTPEGIIESIVEGGKTMNYEVGDKFVIEIESIYKQYLSETYEKPIFLYKMKGFNSLVFDKAGLDKLTPVQAEKKVKEFSVGEEVMQKKYISCSKVPETGYGYVIVPEYKGSNRMVILTHSEKCPQIVAKDNYVSTGHKYEFIQEIVKQASEML